MVDPQRKGGGEREGGERKKGREAASEENGEGGGGTEQKRRGARRREACLRDRAHECEDRSVGNCRSREAREHGIVAKEEKGRVCCQMPRVRERRTNTSERRAYKMGMICPEVVSLSGTVL